MAFPFEMPKVWHEKLLIILHIIVLYPGYIFFCKSHVMLFLVF